MFLASGVIRKQFLLGGTGWGRSRFSPLFSNQEIHAKPVYLDDNNGFIILALSFYYIWWPHFGLAIFFKKIS